MSLAAVAIAVNRVLDPDKNNSTEPPKQRGHYRQQYRAAARDGLWGTVNAGCGQNSMVAVEDGRLRLAPVLCGQWSCRLCGPQRAAWLKRELRLAQERHNLNQFWTLTIWTDLMPAKWSDRAICAAWNRLRGKLVRLYGPLSYVWIREHTKRGYAHLHLLTDCQITAEKLSDLWRAASGGSYIVDVQPVESDRAGDYLAKYCTQQATDRALPQFAHLKHTRFFSTSRNVKFAPFRAAGQKVAHTDTETGEITYRSPWRIVQIPYWHHRDRLTLIHGPPVLERVQGQPSATFATA